MKKVLFFPYHPDFITLINHMDALHDFEIIGLLSFNEDQSLVDSLNCALGQKDLSCEKLVSACDTVILLDNYRGYRQDKYYRVIEDAINHQKEVFVTPLAKSQLDLEKYVGQYSLLELLPAGIENIENEYILRKGQKLYEIDIPVIAVIGTGKHCGKFENQLLLKEVLEEEHETVAVSSNALGALFGCYTMPSFLYEDFSFEEKIIKFNCYMRKLAYEGDPDVIVVGIPEGILPFERQEFHHFAEYPLVISSAVQIDMAVLCTYYMSEYSASLLEQSLNTLANFCQNKFDICIDLFAISRTAVETPGEDHEKIIFEILDEPFLRKHYPDLTSVNLKTINMLNPACAKKVISTGLSRLQNNVGTV